MSRSDAVLHRRPWFDMVDDALSFYAGLGQQLRELDAIDPNATDAANLESVAGALRVAQSEISAWRELLAVEYQDQFGATKDYRRLVGFVTDQLRKSVDIQRMVRFATLDSTVTSPEAVWSRYRGFVHGAATGSALLAPTSEVLHDMFLEREPGLEWLCGFRPRLDGTIPDEHDLNRLANMALFNVQAENGRGIPLVVSLDSYVDAPTQQWLADVTAMRGRLEDPFDARLRSMDFDSAVTTVDQWIGAARWLDGVARADFAVAEDLVRDRASIDELCLLLDAPHYRDGFKREVVWADEVAANPQQFVAVAMAKLAGRVRDSLGAKADPTDARSDADRLQAGWNTLLEGWKRLQLGCERQVSCVLDEHEELRTRLVRRLRLPDAIGDPTELDAEQLGKRDRLRGRSSRVVARSLIVEAGEGRAVDLRSPERIIPSQASEPASAVSEIADGTNVPRHRSERFDVSRYLSKLRDDAVAAYRRDVSSWNERFSDRVGPDVVQQRSVGDGRTTFDESGRDLQPVERRRRRSLVEPLDVGDAPERESTTERGATLDREPNPDRESTSGSERDDSQRSGDDAPALERETGRSDVPNHEATSTPAYPLEIDSRSIDPGEPDGRSERNGREDRDEPPGGRPL